MKPHNCDLRLDVKPQGFMKHLLLPSYCHRFILESTILKVTFENNKSNCFTATPSTCWACFDWNLTSAVKMCWHLNINWHLLSFVPSILAIMLEISSIHTMCLCEILGLIREPCSQLSDRSPEGVWALELKSSYQPAALKKQNKHSLSAVTISQLSYSWVD